MRAQPQCFPCSLQQILSLKKHLPDFSDEQMVAAMMDAMRRLSARKLSELTPADVTTECMAAGTRAAGNPDPFREEKRRFNALAREALPALEQRIGQSADQLRISLQIAAAGNIIDLGLIPEADVEAHLEQVLARGFAVDDHHLFAEAVSTARTLLFVADNAGEIVFDRPLVERLAARMAVTVAVKEAPILNDATREDALAAGLDRWANIITTGRAVLGVPADASPAFWKAFREADVVLAKGHANFESLETPHPNLFFLLTAKCPVVARALGVKEGEAVLKKYQYFRKRHRQG